jgi:hypothetical protein
MWWTAPQGTLTWNAFGGTLGAPATSFPLIKSVPRVITLPPSMVQDWVSDPLSNYGMALALDPSSSAAVGEAFRSSEWGSCNDQPALQVCYNP